MSASGGDVSALNRMRPSLMGFAKAKGIPASLTFRKGQIDSYTLSLGVPREPTEGQWEALCKAYQIAKDRVALESLAQNRPLSINFDITDVA